MPREVFVYFKEWLPSLFPPNLKFGSVIEAINFNAKFEINDQSHTDRGINELRYVGVK